MWPDGCSAKRSAGVLRHLPKGVAHACLPQKYEGISASQLPEHWLCPSCEDGNAHPTTITNQHIADIGGEEHDNGGQEAAHDMEADAPEIVGG